MSVVIEVPIEEVVSVTNWDIYPLATYGHDDDPKSL